LEVRWTAACRLECSVDSIEFEGAPGHLDEFQEPIKVPSLRSERRVRPPPLAFRSQRLPRERLRAPGLNRSAELADRAGGVQVLPAARSRTLDESVEPLVVTSQRLDQHAPLELGLRLARGQRRAAP
jgi:hypothetical protein